MWQTAKEVELAFDPAEDLLRGDEELEVAQTDYVTLAQHIKEEVIQLTQIPNADRAHVAKEARVRHERGNDGTDEQGRRPGRDLG